MYRQQIEQMKCCNHFNTRLYPDERPVQNNLSLTPSEMLRLTEQGLPVNPLNLADDQFSDSDNTPYNDFSVMPHRERGATPAGLWEQQQSARKKFRQAKADGAFKERTESTSV